jgi:predicted transcriptional regulator
MNTREAVILPLKPRYAESIIAGTKRVELRRRRPSVELPVKAFLYATAPFCAVVAVCEIVRCFNGSLEDAWDLSNLSAGVSRADFEEYFSGLEEANVLGIEKVRPFARPVRLRELKELLQWKSPLRSHRYLSDLDVAALMLNGFSESQETAAG